MDDDGIVKPALTSAWPAVPIAGANWPLDHSLVWEEAKPKHWIDLVVVWVDRLFDEGFLCWAPPILPLESSRGVPEICCTEGSSSLLLQLGISYCDMNWQYLKE